MKSQTYRLRTQQAALSTQISNDNPVMTFSPCRPIAIRVTARRLLASFFRRLYRVAAVV
jgi:hypothetical protein